MGNPKQEGTKVEDEASPASAPPATGTDDDYYDLPDYSHQGQENLPPANPGQSRTHVGDGTVVTRGEPPNALIEPEPGNAQSSASNYVHGAEQNRTDAFILRNLPTFKGDYNGSAITDWVHKVDLLKRLTNAPDATILPLLALRVDTQVIHFMERLRQQLGPTQYNWDKVKQALLQQFGGIVDPAKQVSKLHSSRMERETPVRKFAQEVDRRARLAYPELASDLGTPEQKETQRTILNRIALEQFVSGLPPMLSRAIVERQIDDFDKEVNLAAHLEEVNARYFKKSTINAFFNPDGSGQPDYTSAHTFSAPDSRTRRDNTYQVPRGRGGQRPQQGRTGGGTNAAHDNRRQHPSGPLQCFQCGRTGHLKVECLLTSAIWSYGHEAEVYIFLNLPFPSKPKENSSIRCILSTPEQNLL